MGPFICRVYAHMTRSSWGKCKEGIGGIKKRRTFSCRREGQSAVRLSTMSLLKVGCERAVGSMMSMMNTAGNLYM